MSGSSKVVAIVSDRFDVAAVSCEVTESVTACLADAKTDCNCTLILSIIVWTTEFTVLLTVLTTVWMAELKALWTPVFTLFKSLDRAAKAELTMATAPLAREPMLVGMPLLM